MKKILALLVALVAALSVSASAQGIIYPSWLGNLSTGQSYTYGEYSVSKGFAEGAFTPTTFVSDLSFGDGVTGADIAQSTSTSKTGQQFGSVDRQLIGQSASAYAVYNDLMKYWDPEKPNTALVAQMGITKNQFATFSGALRADLIPVLETAIDINGDNFPDDHFTGGHPVTHVVSAAMEDPSWTASYSDDATVFTPTAELNQEVVDATVTISADSAGTVDVDPSIALYQDPDCDGFGDIWQGYGDPTSSTNPFDPSHWADQKQLYDNNGIPATTDDLIDLAVTVTGSSPTSQLTEMSSTMDSDVTLVQTVANNANGPVLTTSLAGSSSLGGSFMNAFLDPGVKLSVDINTGSVPFNYWWEQP